MEEASAADLAGAAPHPRPGPPGKPGPPPRGHAHGHAPEAPPRGNPPGAPPPRGHPPATPPVPMPAAPTDASQEETPRGDPLHSSHGAIVHGGVTSGSGVHRFTLHGLGDNDSESMAHMPSLPEFDDEQEGASNSGLVAPPSARAPSPTPEDVEALRLAAQSRVAGRAAGAQRRGLGRMQPVPLASPTLLLSSSAASSSSSRGGRRSSSASASAVKQRNSQVGGFGAGHGGMGRGLQGAAHDSATARSQEIRQLLRRGRSAIGSSRVTSGSRVMSAAASKMQRGLSGRHGRLPVPIPRSTSHSSNALVPRPARLSKESTSQGTASRGDSVGGRLDALLRGLLWPQIVSELSDRRAARMLGNWLDEQLAGAREQLDRPGQRAARAAVAALASIGDAGGGQAVAVSGMGRSQRARVDGGGHAASTTDLALVTLPGGRRHGATARVGTGTGAGAGGWQLTVGSTPVRSPEHALSLRSTRTDPLVLALQGYWRARLGQVTGPGSGAEIMGQAEGGHGHGHGQGQGLSPLDAFKARGSASSSSSSFLQAGASAGAGGSATSGLPSRMEQLLRRDADGDALLGVEGDEDGLSRAILDSSELSRRAFQARRLLSVSVDVLCAYESAATELFRRLGRSCAQVGRSLAYLWDRSQGLWERRLGEHIDRMEEARAKTDVERAAAAGHAARAADQQDENAVARTAMVQLR